MFHLKEHFCSACGHRWRDSLDNSVCPKTLDHTQIIRERILGPKKEEVAAEAAKPLAKE